MPANPPSALPAAPTPDATTSPPDERPLMGITAGWLWLTGAAVIVAGLFVPGTERPHTVVVLVLAAAIAVYGVACVRELIDWQRMSLAGHAWFAAASLGAVCPLMLWATGGAASYAQPLLALATLFVAYFFPPRMGWPVIGLIMLTAVSPLLYDERALHGGFAGRLLVITVTYAALTKAMQLLKRRLVDAEARQRGMATTDPLTRLGNRRALGAALGGEVARLGRPGRGRRAGDEMAGFALVVLDLDGFKFVNDRHGHPTGDDVLRALADRMRAAVRPHDTAARIGGDEFAVVAPGAGPHGARRLAATLVASVAEVAGPAGERLSATAAWALYPDDAESADDLVRVADRRLYAGKRGDAVGAADVDGEPWLRGERARVATRV